MARQLLNDAAFPVKERDLELGIPIDEDASYWLRPLTVEKLREFTKANTRQVPNKRTHQKDDIVDQIAASNEALDYVIERWEGVKLDGAAAPCTLEYKLRLPMEVQMALVQAAQIGQVTPEAKAESFRQPADVR